MGENISEIKRGLQNSFSNIKEDINLLKKQISKNNKEVSELKELIKDLRKEIKYSTLNKKDTLQQDILNMYQQNIPNTSWQFLKIYSIS